jgi:GntR family transcriptional repressor for pyruvate dehydrogenase complex
MFQPIKNQKIYQQVVEQVQAMLLDGTLVKGDRLPSERDMSERFQVSRASIREALRALEIIGIVECRQGGGNYIRSTFDQHVFEPLSVMFKLNNGTFKDILEYRMIFEPAAAAMAAERIQPGDASVLAELSEKLVQSDDDNSSAQIDQQIHLKIVEISGNYLMQSTMMATSVIMQSFIKEARDYLFQWRENRKQLVQLHCNICDAVIQKNTELASRESRNHFEFIIDNIQI